MTIRRRITWLAILLAVGLAEVLLLLYVLVGPLRFEHGALAFAAGLGRVVPEEVALPLPGGRFIRRVDQRGMYQWAVDVERTDGVGAAAALYSDEFARESGSRLPLWLEEQAPHNQVQAAWQIGDGQDWVEYGWMTSDLFLYSGLPAADGLYRVDIQQGQIADQAGDLTTTTKAWLLAKQTGAAGPAGPTMLEGIVLGAALVLFVGGGAWVFRVARGGRRPALGTLVLVPVLTILTFTLLDPSGSSLATMLPNAALYQGHAALAVGAEWLGDGRGSALQWVKALGHEHADAQVAEAARGIARARTGPAVDLALCDQWRIGAPWTKVAIDRAGVACADLRAGT